MPEELQAALQRLSGTTLDAQGAANAWAGTTGLDLVGALNAQAGTSGLELEGVLRNLAGVGHGDRLDLSTISSGPGAPTFREAAFGGVRFGDPAEVTIPSLVEVDDFMVIGIATVANTPATPTGWTLLRSDVSTGSGTNARHYTYWKVAEAGDTGGATVVSSSLGGSDRWTMVFGAWSGATQIALDGADVSTADGTTLTAPSLEAASACEAVQLFGGFSASGTVPAALTTPDTERVQSGTPEGSGGRFIRSALCSQTLTEAGPTGEQTATKDLTGAWVGVTLVVTA